ncbi:hypothetical protein B0G81_5029 [Paraburkholderia sp. BL6665CI2N2]|uniref:hypothetical protein n=1 Tax=Paraburkholderia sp. BL6665CI2N2 TaxID=1938806 RepID=UPI0010652B33|nr:hypothetical protein [Paraburkholderia sp. BL6665CI2N2]TDY24590.1 hypothetical protein B0G81_5029 [Paraburkholderia sp. BL6665CI2N2]
MELSIEKSRVFATAPETRSDAMQASIELLCLILGDADSDIRVVARDLGLSDAAFVGFGGHATGLLARKAYWKQ